VENQPDSCKDCDRLHSDLVEATRAHMELLNRFVGAAVVHDPHVIKKLDTEIRAAKNTRDAVRDAHRVHHETHHKHHHDSGSGSG